MGIELKFESMLEVSELVAALRAREKMVDEIYTWQGEDGTIKKAIKSLTEQVRGAYPFMFD